MSCVNRMTIKKIKWFSIPLKKISEWSFESLRYESKRSLDKDLSNYIINFNWKIIQTGSIFKFMQSCTKRISLNAHSQVWDNFWQLKAQLKWWKMLISPWKLFSFSRYSSFCLDILVMYGNGLIKKIRLISNFMTSQPG